MTLAFEAVDLATSDWLATAGVIDARSRKWLSRIQPAKLAAYAFPYAPLDRLRLCSDLIAWLFLFDDAYADGTLAENPFQLRAQHARYNPLLGGALDAAPSNPFGKSLAELLGRFGTLAPAEWVLRLGASIRLYLDGCELETSFRWKSHSPSLEAYLWYRDRSIGVYPMLDLVEFAANAYLTPAEAADPFVSALRRAANLTMALTNDLHSSPKEAEEAESFNAVLVTQRQQSLTLEQARQSVKALRDRFEGETNHYVACVTEVASPGLRALIKGIPIWEGGNRRWSSECPRYNELETLVEGFVPPPSAPRLGRPLEPRRPSGEFNLIPRPAPSRP